MTDNITLPREVVEGALEALDSEHPDIQLRAAIALRTALAAEPTKPSGYAYRHADGALWFNNGCSVNGGLPVEVVPYWFAPPALAAEQPKPEPVAWRPRLSPNLCFHWSRPWNEGVPSEQTVDYWSQKGAGVEYAYAAPPDAPTVKESLTHPGYVIGSHWLETAYSRICAGEAEDAILEDYEVLREPRLRDLRRDAERYKWVLGWLVRTGLLSCKACRIDTPESYGNWWILRKPWSIDDGSFVAYGADLKDAIDAAMEGKR